MIWEVIKKEIKSNISSPKILITYIVCIVLILTSFITGTVSYLNLRDEITLQAANEKDRLTALYNYQLDYMVGGMNLYRLPDRLSVLVSGVGGDAAQRGTVSYYVDPGFDVSKFNSTPILALFGVLDLEFVVKMILSLFALLFTFDAVSGEKEQGTLKLNFASSIKRSGFLIGKLIGNFVLLIIPFIIPVLLGFLVLSFVPGMNFNSEEWIRIGFIILSFTLYLLVFYSIGIMVSSLTSRSSVSFLILLMIWVALISIFPRGAVLIAQNVEPVPPIDEVRKAYFSEFGSSQRGFYDAIKKELEEFFADIKAGKFSQERQNEMNDAILVAHDDWARGMRERGVEISHEQDMKQEQQNKLAIAISRLSTPAAALTFATQRLARTGVYTLDKQFRDNVRNMQGVYVEKNDEVIAENPGLLSGQGMPGQMIDASEAYPDLTLLKKEPLNESINAVLQDFTVMVLMSVLFVAIAFVAFLRYDVR